MTKRAAPEWLRGSSTHDFSEAIREVWKFPLKANAPSVDVVSYRWECKRCGIVAVENIVDGESYVSYDRALNKKNHEVTCDFVIMSEALE